MFVLSMGWCTSYKENLQNQLTKLEHSSDPNKTLVNMLKCMERSATDTVGVLKGNNKSRNHTDDPLVKQLSERQKALRLRIYQKGQSEDRTYLRMERNNILHSISKRLKEIEIARADSLVNDIITTDECRKMFKAARALRIASPLPSLSVVNAEGNFIVTDQGKADTISEWFEKQFTDPDKERLDPFVGNAKPLETPITTIEVEMALKTLKNGRSPGPDGISNELYKYGSNIISQTITSIFQLCL